MQGDFNNFQNMMKTTEKEDKNWEPWLNNALEIETYKDLRGLLGLPSKTNEGPGKTKVQGQKQ